MTFSPYIGYHKCNLLCICNVNTTMKAGYQKNDIRWYPDTRQSDVGKTNCVQNNDSAQLW